MSRWMLCEAQNKSKSIPCPEYAIYYARFHEPISLVVDEGLISATDAEFCLPHLANYKKYHRSNLRYYSKIWPPYREVAE